MQNNHQRAYVAGPDDLADLADLYIYPHIVKCTPVYCI